MRRCAHETAETMSSGNITRSLRIEYFPASESSSSRRILRRSAHTRSARETDLLPLLIGSLDDSSFRCPLEWLGSAFLMDRFFLFHPTLDLCGTSATGRSRDHNRLAVRLFLEASSRRGKPGRFLCLKFYK